MTHRDDNNQNQKLLDMLADINKHMIDIRKIFGKNPTISIATRGCDIRQYKDMIIDETVCCFESYVEARTRTEAVFCWSLDITLTSDGWKFQRRIAKQTTDGEQLERYFEGHTFKDLSDLAGSYLAAMIEFVDTAKNFDFGI